jgi:DNA mismatch repair protein MutS
MTYLHLGKTLGKVKKSSKETPLMVQYNGIKDKYPDAMLLFRVGDFYETFGEDAVKASKILDIVLTKRSNGAAADMALAGFPYHALETYLPKLVRSGLRVAICEQMENPKDVKGIVKRDVAELVTPGLTMSDNVLEHRSNNYLCALHMGNSKIGVAFLDISTGEFSVSEGSIAHVAKLIDGLSPSEIIFQRRFRDKFHEDFGEGHCTFTMEDWVFTQQFGTDILTNQFGTKSLKGFGIAELISGIIAAGACLQYLIDTKHNEIGHIQGLGRIELADHVWIDRFTARNLELLKPSNPDGKCLLDVMDYTNCAMGARMIKRWIALPLTNANVIKVRHDRVTDLIDDRDLADSINELIGQMGDLERLAAKISTGRINPREFILLKKSLELTETITTLLAGSESDIANMCSAMATTDDLFENIEKMVTDEPPALLHKGQVIKPGISSELDEYRNISTHGKDRLLGIQEREIKQTGIPKLKIGFNNVFGYYLEVSNAHKDKVPEEWIRKQTLVNAERYITEELKELEEKIISAQGKISDIEVRLYNDLINESKKSLPQLLSNARLLAELDCLSSFATAAYQNQWVRPHFGEKRSIIIKDGRHPVIESSLPLGEKYVPNDVTLDADQQQILMITGPNMSGKSALLRQTAIISLMAQLGSFVPARSAELFIVDKIFSRVGASDNISSGESTFMVEMNETASILHNMTSDSLIILDEIGRGTSTYDGISIAMAIAEFLHDNNRHRPLVLFATHYHELNDLESEFARIRNFHVSIEEKGKQVIFLRKLEPGGTAHSFGIHVAKMAGMPSKVVTKANQILSTLEKSQKHNDKTEANKKQVDDLQLSFFQLDDPILEQVREAILQTDIDTLTPIEALFKLNEIKKLLRGH